jgi:hypothetical protein
VTPIDRAAFDLAIEIAKDPVQRRRFDDRLAAGEDYATVGKAAAYHCQIESLQLLPWQSPPCYADMSALDQPFGDPRAAREGAELALRMRRLNVSRWHPNPAHECDRIEAEATRRTSAK